MKEEDSEIGEEKDSSRSEPTSTSKAKMSQQQGGDASVPDCAVCLQTCVHPVELPCSHIFCFLCVKGASTQYRRCALCRQEIPVDFFTSPKLLLAHEGDVDEDDGEEVEEHYTWFYEGRNGWWQYDERTSIELEESYRTNKRTFELLIAGYVYVIDLDSMLQYRRADPSRRRRIKRDLVNAPKKGIAGLKIKVKREEESADREVVGAEEEKENAGAVGGTLTTQTVGNKNKSSKKKTNNDKRSSQIEDDIEGDDDDDRNGRTATSNADRGDAASGESVYEVHLTGASSSSPSSRTSTEQTTSQRSAARSPHADEPAAYAVPVRQRRKPSDSPAANNSQVARDAQSNPATASPDQNPSQNVTVSSTGAGGLPVHHQRTHSAPEVRPLPRPRGNPPLAPPRTHSSIQNIRHSSGRPEESSSSTSNQSTRPSTAGPEEDTADSVEDLSERVRSELVINIERSSGARRRQTHHQVHEV